MALPSLLDPNSSPSVLPAAVGGLPPIPQLASDPSSNPIAQQPSAIPQLSSGGLRPLVTNPRQQQEEQLQQSLLPKPGQPGFWHALGRVASKIGNVAGDVLAPNITALIPGSDLNRVMQHNYNQAQLSGLQEQDQTEQDNASKRNLEGAQAAQAEDGKVTPLATDQGYVSFNGSTGEVQPLNDKSGQQLQPKDKQTPESVHVLPDGKVVSISKDANGKPQATIVYQGDPTVKTEVKQIEVGGKPHQVLINSQTGEQVKDLGETGEKPPVINVNADKGRNFQEQERGRGLLDKAEGAYRSAQQGANTMRDMLAQADAGNKMSAQILPLEGALQITTAQGVHRINRTEVEQYAGAGSLYDKIQGELGKVSSGQPIPPNIRQDIRKLVSAQEKQAYVTYKGAYDSATKRYNLTGEDALPEPGGGGPTDSGQVFDAKAWAAANPGKDVNKAIAKAQSLGHQVKQ